MKITPEMLDQSALDPVVEKNGQSAAICAYLNAMIESGKARIEIGWSINGPFSKPFDESGYPVLICPLIDKTKPRLDKPAS